MFSSLPIQLARYKSTWQVQKIQNATLTGEELYGIEWGWDVSVANHVMIAFGRIFCSSYCTNTVSSECWNIKSQHRTANWTNEVFQKLFHKITEVDKSVANDCMWKNVPLKCTNTLPNAVGYQKPTPNCLKKLSFRRFHFIPFPSLTPQSSLL